MQRRWAMVILALAFLSCRNAGEDRVLSVSGMAFLTGVVYFDLDGSGTFADPDIPLSEVNVALLFSGALDTVATDVTAIDGRFEFLGVPVGRFSVAVDPATLADTVEVVGIATQDVDLTPGDSLDFGVSVGFPQIDVVGARVAPADQRVFLEGVAVNGSMTFGDSTVHVVDSLGAIRAMGVRDGTVNAGDSVRLRGLIALRNGEVVLDRVVPFTLGSRSLAAPDSVGTALVGDVDSTRLAAALVRVAGATIEDTVMVAGDLRLTVDDGSGSLDVVIDRDISVQYDPFVPGVVVDVAGVVVREPNIRVLKPRGSADISVTVAAATVAEARSGALGREVVIRAVAEHAASVFADTAVHVLDATGAIRALSTEPLDVEEGDSVAVRGVTALRDGQRVLRDAGVAILGTGTLPPHPTVLTATAAAAGGGGLDARLVGVTNAVVQDTATVGTARRVTVNDGSGAVTVLVSAVSGIDPSPYVPGAVVAVRGILVPATAGVWRLVPRETSDLDVLVPFVSIAQARAALSGTIAATAGIALNSSATFGDGTVHVVDPTGAIRVTGLGGQGVTQGDSVRIRGTLVPVSGQPTIAATQTVILTATVPPPATTLSTPQAASAASGTRDAQLVRITDATITTRATSVNDALLTVNDGSGALTVRVDGDAGIDADALLPGAIINVTGLLVPEGAGGTWALNPRANADVVVTVPVLRIDDARTQPVGTDVVLAGVALNRWNLFADSIVHLRDVSGTIRVTELPSTVVFAGDSVCIRGMLGTRDGQPVLRATAFQFIANLGTPMPTVVSTADAATAMGARLDAALVRITAATIASSAPTGAGLAVVVNDGTGAVTVLLDADVTFDASAITPGATMSATGLLTPSGGSWIIKPRSDADFSVN